MVELNREGYGEAVVFAFFKEGKLLIERRPGKDGEEVFIPNGGIEEKDKNGGEDYRIKALKREAKEEMNIEVIDYEFLMELKVEEIKIWFYVYVVTKWNGEIPDFTVEPPGSNQKFADLEWIGVREYENVFVYDSAKQILRKIIEKFSVN